MFLVQSFDIAYVIMYQYNTEIAKKVEVHLKNSVCLKVTIVLATFGCHFSNLPKDETKYPNQTNPLPWLTGRVSSTGESEFPQEMPRVPTAHARPQSSRLTSAERKALVYHRERNISQRVERMAGAAGLWSHIRAVRETHAPRAARLLTRVNLRVFQDVQRRLRVTERRWRLVHERWVKNALLSCLNASI